MFNSTKPDATDPLAPFALPPGRASRGQAPSPQRPEKSGSRDARLDTLLNRIQNLSRSDTDGEEPAAPPNPRVSKDASGAFIPPEPQSYLEAGLGETQVEQLVMKYLLARGDAQGRHVATHLRLPFAMVDQQLRRLKQEQLVVYRDAAEVNDYQYQLTDLGRERARRYTQECSYFGAAPITLESYIQSVAAQSLTGRRPSERDLRRAFGDLLISPPMLRRLGPAINSGRGMFLYGFPGNGKTSIAERVTRCFGDHIWIPRAIGVDGDIIRVYDPNHHVEVPLQHQDGLIRETHYDHRWVRIQRPTIVVGGELTMEQLELHMNRHTNINEAPVQMKSNCGTLVIDDFGRQRMRTDELLNRWIVPLEKRYDVLSLPSGKSIQVPFDQLVIFSTNLEPKDLVDDAFLRRIPYKIEVENPSEADFIELFKMMAPVLGIAYQEGPVRYLIERHYRPIHRPLRCCQPRDILLQVKNLCLYEGVEPVMTNERMDFAVENYFAIM